MTTNFDFAQSREYLQTFDFTKLFRESLGWSRATSRKGEEIEIEDAFYQRRMIAQVSGVAVYEVESPDGKVPGEKVRKSIQEQTAELSLEHLLIFVDADRTQSYWYWVKRDGKKLIPRHLSYYKGQSGDLILGKLSGLVFELKDFEEGDPAVVEVARRLQSALDVERVTKKFYGDFKVHLEWFVEQIQGIGDKNDRRWYASVILNRLMFVYFLQYKGFVDGNPNYLRDKLELFEGKEFYRDFLKLLFFEGFAKAAPNRSDEAKALLGEIKYLNGGLFLEHRIEKQYQGITIDNEAFDRTLALFEKYSWNLDDAPGGSDDEIRPEVLGYIFEKYINQKEFGAYYTRPEITEYLCDRTINKLVLDKVNVQAGRRFESIEEMLFNLDADLCILLLDGILPKLSLLDPACGSGAFLVAAMKTLINVYSAVIGRIEFIKNPTLTQWLQKIRDEHPSVQYYIKKRIITDNLYGVDIMEEATEITKLRLFLALVASAAKLEELEPLPNVDFNVMAGNSLIGLIGVDADGFDAVEETATQRKKRAQDKRWGVEPVQVNLLEATFLQGSLLQPTAVTTYRQILEEKNYSISQFKERAFRSVGSAETGELTEVEVSAEILKDSIDKLNQQSQRKLNKLLFDEFGELKIKYEEAQATGKATKRLLVQADIDRLEPFHWGYHFDQIITGRGGFDAIIANPPWEVFKPNAKEFFAHHSDLVSKKKMDIHSFEKEQSKLLQDPEIAEAWLDYQSQFPHMNLYYRTTPEYGNQISIIDGKKAKTTDINLYKLFLERCFNLLKPSGYCGIIMPTGFYTDLGTKQLREMIFSRTRLDSLIGLSNEKFIFEGVHHAFKFCLLTFEKGHYTDTFEACFRINPREAIRPAELEDFLNDKTLRIKIPTEFVRKLSPESLSITEFKVEIDVQIARKLLQFPLLGEKLPNSWNLRLCREFHMTDDSHLYKQQSTKGRLPLYEGKMIHQFTHRWSEPKYWLDESEARKELMSSRVKYIQKVVKDNSLKFGIYDEEEVHLDYETYRVAFRDVSASSNERTFISTILPPKVYCPHTMSLERVYEDNFFDGKLQLNSQSLNWHEKLYLCSLFNSFVIDNLIRQRVSSHISFFYVNQIPVPRLTKADRVFQQIVDRAAKLICTTPEFDDLAAEVGLGSHTNGTTDETDRAKLRAELDGIIAHLYHLTEPEFTHILSTFPIVPQATKDAALQAYRDLTPPVAEPEILTLLQQGESGTVEFKSTARWNLRDSKKDRTMEEVILKTVAAFLNSQGGTLLIGVADDGSILGLDPDYQTLKKKDRDGFELWLMGDLLLKEMGKAIAPSIGVTFHTVDQNEICKIVATPAPEPVYVNITDKSGQAKENFFIRTGNSTNQLDKPSELTKYLKRRWL
jgi:Putative DNA-binding domain/Eco57I restriction-modification methylase